MGELIALHTRSEALTYGDQWREYAERMEDLYALAKMRYTASEALLEAYRNEVERLRGLL